MTQLSMDEILADEAAPEAELAVEQMSVDERADLEDARRAQAEQASTEQDADTSTAEPEAGAEPKQEQQQAEPEKPDLSDIPESIRRTLEKRPEDADNWRNLREIAKDSQKAAKEAAERVAAEAAERARLEAELNALRSTQAEQQAQARAAQAQANLPDPDADPAGYVQAALAAERETLRAEIRSQQLDGFEHAAKAKHGAEKVESAFAWATTQANSDPAFAAQLSAAFDPWDFVVAEQARRETLAQMGDDPSAYLERIRAEAAEAALARFREEQGQASSEQVEAEIAKRLPRSLAKTPGAGGQAVSDGYAGPTPMSQIVGPNSG